MDKPCTDTRANLQQTKKDLMKRLLVGLCCCSAFFAGCKDEKTTAPPQPENVNTMPAFYLPAAQGEYGTNTPYYEVIANSSDQVSLPWDLDFHPSRENELWVLNKGTERTGGSTVTITNAGLSNQKAEFRKDGNSWHFMALPSAISFSQENDNWANATEILDANRRGGSFTGPSLWSSDMNVYAKPSGGNGSHLDMLHGSPYCMGIESDKDNAFWVFDGFNKHLCWYDFAVDHGPGNSDHDDGKIHRYREIILTREPDVASHMVLDKVTGWLYIVDSGTKRILKVNTKTGTKKGNLNLTNEQLLEHWDMVGMDYKVFASSNLQKPSGIELSNGVIYVSDNETGEIIAYNLETGLELGRLDTGKKGIMGIKADKNGLLWFVCASTNEVIKINPK
ncbi:MAG: outer membrane protein assembly factor BamB [Bacteroidia bacterium]